MEEEYDECNCARTMAFMGLGACFGLFLVMIFLIVSSISLHYTMPYSGDYFNLNDPLFVKALIWSVIIIGIECIVILKGGMWIILKVLGLED